MKNALTIVFIILCLALLGADFAIHRHGYFDFEDWHGFYPLVGAGSCVVIIAIGLLMKLLLKRPADYYDKNGGGA